MDNLTPPFFEILTSTDKEKYMQLRKSFSSEKNRYQRYHRMDAFDSTLEEIRKFCIKKDSDDWKRCVVCGICWLKGALGINVKQLMLLLCKSKSNINGVLSKIGYMQDQSSEKKKNLVETIPFLRGNYLEQRFWTIRVKPNEDTSDSFNSSEVSSPEVVQAETPQPYVRKEYPLIDVPGGDVIKNIFDVINLKIEAGRECGIDPESLDFFSDPICCCPAEWITPIPSNEMISFA